MIPQKNVSNKSRLIICTPLNPIMLIVIKNIPTTAKPTQLMTDRLLFDDLEEDDDPVVS